MINITTAIQGPECHSHGIRGSGTRDPQGRQVMLLGISPGRNEMTTGVPMTGHSGKLANSILEACGWSRDRVYVTNLVCYENRAPTPQDILECRPRLEREVALVKPKLVVLLGQIVTAQFFGDRTFASKSGTGVRGNLAWYKPWNCYLLPTYHPAAILYGDSGKFIANDIVRDFQKIPEFFLHPPMRTPPQFYVVEGVQQAQVVLDNLPKNKFVALDIETPLKDEDETAAIEDPISCFSISDGERTWWFPGELAAQVQWPMDVQWTFHNGPYDTITLAQRTGTLLPIVHDTMYMSYALDERGGHHGLKGNLRETEAVGFYEEAWGNGAKATKQKVTDKYGHTEQEVVVSEWDARRKADPEGFRRYNATDAWGTARLAQRYYRRVYADNMDGVYNDLLMPAVNTYRLMQRHGVMVGQTQIVALLETWIPMRDAKLQAFQSMALAAGGPLNLNPNSPQQMSKFMYQTLGLPGGPSTGKEQLEALAGMHPCIDMLEDYRHLKKAMGTYVEALWPAVKQSTMRVHPWPKLHGIVTGRVAYFNPAINTTPRAYSPNPYLQKIKLVFVVPPGKVLIELDYRQAECWVAWIYSQDPTLLADLRSGDLHRQTAAYINKVAPDQVTTYQRAKAKNTTFGMLYGIGATKLAKQNAISDSEARHYIREWRNRYTEYPKYADRMLKSALRNGEVVTITGRKRRYPCAGVVGDLSISTETTNFAIQATSHDYLLASIVEGWPLLEKLGAAIILDVHDACLIEADKRNWQDVAKAMSEVMSKPRFGVDLSLPVEVKVGPSWGELKDVEL